MLAAYVYDLDPVLISFTENLKIRWYGLAYLAGFIAAWWILKQMAAKKLYPIVPEKISDFVAYGAFLGVFLGGRLGYVLFYMLPSAAGRAEIAADPLTIIKVWDGGMSSHGGILGITIFAWFYARKHQISWSALGDGIVCVAPLGVFFGRIANFINGELYGTVAKGLPWLVKFPGTITNPACAEQKDYFAVMNVATETANGEFQALVPAGLSEEQLKAFLTTNPEAMASSQVVQNLDHALQTGYGSEQALAAAVRHSDAVKAAIEPFLLLRHPSQIYEGLIEGLFLFLILITLRFKFPRLPNGTLTGLFFLLYGMGRIFVEQFRVPDSELVFHFLTKGQFYSIFFLVMGVAFLLHAYRNKGISVTQKPLA